MGPKYTGHRYHLPLPVMTIRAIVFKGLKPSELERLHVTARGLRIVEIGPGYTEDGERMTAGEILQDLNALEGRHITGGAFSLVMAGQGQAVRISAKDATYLDFWTTQDTKPVGQIEIAILQPQDFGRFVTP